MTTDANHLDENSLTCVSFQPNYVQSLHNLLTQSTSNDTATLKAVCLIVHAKFGPNPHRYTQATTALNKNFYPSPACIPALSQIIADSPDQPVSSITRRIDGGRLAPKL